MSPDKVSISVWTHWLQVCIPDQLQDFATALVYVDGGRNNDGGGLGGPPREMDTMSGIICSTAGAVVAHLGQVPNQPIVFASDPAGVKRTEDAMVAWTWREFLHNTSYPEWLARLPMTKAVVRAMDTIQAFTNTLPAVKTKIQTFAVAGASKRGWTTWTTAAVDKRVIGMIPMVMPMGNMNPLLNAMYRVYGDWSFALQDYVNADVMGFLGTPQFDAMEAIIDPMVYYPRWHGLPKYVIAAAGDEFFLPDSTRYFWDKLPHPKLLRMAPNAEHSLFTAPAIDVVMCIDTFLQILMRRLALPQFEFALTYSNATASVKAWATGPSSPSAVYAWSAHTLSTIKRDFRLITCAHKEWKCLNPVLWASKKVAETSPGSRVWTVSMPAPSSGWTGFFLEAIYDGGYSSRDPYNVEKVVRVTTSINIVPDAFPFATCEPNCQPPLPWDPRA